MVVHYLVIMQYFLIVASGFNCRRYVHKCFESLVQQTHKNFKAILISDGSIDGTQTELQRLSGRDKRIICESYPQNNGAAKRRYDAIKRHASSPETVVVFLGLDDHLLPNALETIAKKYEEGVWMTYGNWKNQNGIGLPEDFQLEFDEQTHIDRSYRKVKYRSTAPNTFKKFLFDMIPETDFKINGMWINTTTESEVMFSCLEMCGKKRIGLIREYIYIYNENLPGGSLKRLGAAYKRKIYNIIIQRNKKPLYIKPTP